MKRMHYKLFATLCTASVLFFTSCTNEKDYYDPNFKTENPLEEVTAPTDFNWKTTNTLDVNVSVYDEFDGQYNYVIEIFDQNPVTNSSATLITRGFAKKSMSFITKITLPTTTENVFIRQTTPTGLASVRMVSAEANIKCDFASSVSRSTRSVTTRATDMTVNYTPPSHDDASIFPADAPATATEIIGNTWAAAGTSNAYKAYKVTNKTTGISAGQYVELYITEDVILTTVPNIAYRRIFVLPGKKLTVTGGLGASTTGWIISVGSGATLDVRGEFKADHTTQIYNLGTITTTTFHNLKTSVFYNAGAFQVTGTAANAMSMGSTDSSPLLYNIGTVDIKGGWNNTNSATVYNSPTGVLNIAGTFTQNSAGNRFINDNTVTCGGFTSTGSSATQNNGEMTVLGLTEMRSADTWVNNGTWTTENMQTVSYNATYQNNCKLVVNNLFELSQARFVNNAGSYIYAKEYIMVNTRMEMGSESFFYVEGTSSFRENRPNAAEREGFYGTGEKRALLKFAKVVAGNDSPNIVYYGGMLQVACSDHPEPQMPTGQEPRWSMDNNVEFAGFTNHSLSILANGECNPGSGTNPNPPTDPEPEDVVDPLDYTYLFEDQWPLYGDYDMNDVVIKVTKITKAPDANNKVSKLSFTYKLEAVGASNPAAAALMLDGINANNIQSVTYSDKTPTGFGTESSGVESGQSTAVIPLFSNAHTFLGKGVGAFINTVKGGDNVANVPSVTVTITFATPIDMTFEASSFNMFIITDSFNNLSAGSRKEIHQRGYQPSAKVNTTFFGNGNDASTSGLYYVSEDNLVWGIVIPSTFQWPIEYKNIQEAYTNFADWVQSSGANSKDWWKTPASSGVVF